MANGPLHGVRVLDLTEFIFGPYATQILGDLGADVVKVENPGGDRQRHGSKFAKNEDMGATFMTLNRNKRSLTLDLKTDEGRAKLNFSEWNKPVDHQCPKCGNPYMAEVGRRGQIKSPNCGHIGSTLVAAS